MPFLIRDLLLAGALRGLNRVFYAQTQRSTAPAAENWFYFVEKGRPGSSWLVNEMNFSNYPKTRQLIDIFVRVQSYVFKCCVALTRLYCKAKLLF